MVDYIIVGLGLAGIAFCEELEKNNKTFFVFDNNTNASSLVAAGLYNPVILKRFTLAWNATEQLEVAKPFYKRLEQKLQMILDYKIPVLRRFTSYEEQNLWFEASDRRELATYLSLKLLPNTNPSISAPFGYGEVFETGRVDTSVLLDAYRNHLENQNKIKQETFDYSLLEIGYTLQYKHVSAKNIVFTEGFGMHKNPFFDYLPLDGTKGEMLIIHSPQLQLKEILNASIFIIPMEDDLYWVGATYDWRDKEYSVTEEAKEDLLGKLEKLISCPFEIVNHLAGIRPTVRDRKPLVGRHPVNENMFIFNGLGTRGVSIAPQTASQLYDFIENKIPLSKDINIKRYVKLFTP